MSHTGACTASVTATDSNVTVKTPQEISPETIPTHTYETEAVVRTESHGETWAYGEVPAAVLAILVQHQPATAAELAKALGDSSKTGTKRIWQALQRLRASGKVLHDGKQYRLPT